MKGITLIKKINKLLKGKPKKPDCFTTEEFMFCYCGKCKQEDFQLPDDFKRILSIKTAERYLKEKSSVGGI